MPARGRPRCRPRASRRPSPPRPARRRAARAPPRKIAGCGFVRPKAPEPSAASTSQPVVRDELVEVAARVRDEPELEPARAQLGEHRQRVLVELEVLGVLPGPRHLDRALVGRVGVAAHAADDPLGERDPDLLVVLELRVAPDALDRRSRAPRRSGTGRARARSARPAAGSPRARAPGPGRASVKSTSKRTACSITPASSSQRAVSTCVSWSSPSNAHASVCADRPAARALAVEAELGAEPVEAVEHVALRVAELAASARSARAPNSRSPTSGFGSITSHGSRCAARTLSPCRSWCSSTCSPCVGGSSRSASSAASSRRRSNGRPNRSHVASRSSSPPRGLLGERPERRAAPASRAAAAARRRRRAQSRRPPRERRPRHAALEQQRVLARRRGRAAAPRRRRPRARARPPRARSRGAATGS